MALQARMRSVVTAIGIGIAAAVLLAGVAMACEGFPVEGECEKPSVFTDSVGGVTTTGAILNGLVNPHGCTTSWVFEYGKLESGFPSKSLGGKLSMESTSYEPVVDGIGGLSPNTTYHYRLRAENEKGTTTGSEVKFTTAKATPTVVTLAATGVTHETAFLNGEVIPNGAPTTYYFEYGLTKSYGKTTGEGSVKSGGEKVAAGAGGLTPSTTYHFRVVGKTGEGTQPGGDLTFTTSATPPVGWKIQTTPNASGAEHSYLNDISCEPAGTSACTAVGKQTASGGTSSPYAQYWNGSAWTSQLTATPAGTTAAELQADHCLSKTSCVTAGYYTTASGTFSLVEAWNGTAWSIQTTPNPAGSTETRLNGISCQAITACVAVGYKGSGSGSQPVAIGGNSGAWSLQSVPLPAGAVGAELTGVDCTSATSCRAVGRYYPTSSSTTYWAMASTWNGTAWTSEAVSKPTGSPKRSTLLDISCASGSSCAAVGGYMNSSGIQVSYVERWNGSSWAWQSSPNPAGSANTPLQNVSCVESSPCVAVGDWLEESGVWKPMAQSWNGTSWVIDSVPFVAEQTFGMLGGIACRSSCLAVGWYTVAGKDKTLGEIK